MQGNFLSLIPPVITLIVAFVTKRVLLSLFLGIIFAALVATNFAPLDAIMLTINRLWETTELSSLSSFEAFSTNWNLFICLFLTMLGIIITLIGHSGGAYAYGNFVSSRLKDKRDAETSSIILSMLLFVDDYFNSLTVGAVMQPLTDSYKIPRTKLAYLVDSMAAPLCVLSPISSWVAVIIMQLKKSGINDVAASNPLIFAEPFYMYVRILPYIFYSFLTIAATWFIVRRKVSFGLMKKHEDFAEEKGDLFYGRKMNIRGVRTHSESNKNKLSILDFIIPVVTLLISVVSGILYSGGFHLFGGNRGIIMAFQHSEAPIALFIGGGVTLLVTLLLFTYKKKFSWKRDLEVIVEGSQIMLPAIYILLLSWTLANLLQNDLGTGQYLAKVLVGSISLKLFPVMFFIATTCTSFAIGSSWGALAIMFPIAIPLVISFLNTSTPALPNEIALLYPVLGAILSGAVAGDHISPISDTTIMSSTSTGSDHIDHVNTQFGYAFPVLAATTLSFVISGFMPWWQSATNILFSLGSGLVTCLVLLLVLNRK